MSVQTDKQKKDILESIAEYIKEHGKKLTDSFYYWDTYPVVIKDICVSCVAVNDNKIEFGDFMAIFMSGDHISDDINTRSWICKKSEDDISSLKSDREYLENTFKSMKITDRKSLHKQW